MERAAVTVFKKRSPLVRLIRILGVVVIYAFSPGPVMKAMDMVYGDHPPTVLSKGISIVYEPLSLLIDHHMGAWKFYHEYLKLFGLGE